MTDMFLAHVIAMTFFAVCMGIGIWRLFVEGNNIECDGCSNPDHWSVEERAKLTPEQYKTMKDNIERFEKVAEAWN